MPVLFGIKTLHDWEYCQAVMSGFTGSHNLKEIEDKEVSWAARAF